MAQTTAQKSSVDCRIEYSPDNSTWVDLSGTMNKVDIGPQDRAVGNAFSADGDASVLTYGKLQPVDVTFTIIYTETASTEGFQVLRVRHETENGAACYFRWAIITGANQNEYQTGLSKLKSFQYPSVDAGSGDPILTTFTATCAKITTGTST
jgi:hypothetical protein